jgi:hypothetical protein
LSQNIDKPCVKSLRKLFKKYKQLLPLLDFKGPTYFSEALQKCIDRVEDE